MDSTLSDDDGSPSEPSAASTEMLTDDEDLSGSDVGELEFSDDEDTTTPEMRELLGVDDQGIPWQRMQLSRQNYRDLRVKQLDNYLNLPAAVEAASSRLRDEATRCLPPRPRRGRGRALSPSPSFAPSAPPPPPLPLSFSRNSRDVRCSIAHFQLRNLLYTPSLHEAYVVHSSRLYRWDPSSSSSPSPSLPSADGGGGGGGSGSKSLVLDLSGERWGGAGGWNGGVDGGPFDRRDPFAWRGGGGGGGGGAGAHAQQQQRHPPLPPLLPPPPCSGAYSLLGASSEGPAAVDRRVLFGASGVDGGTISAAHRGVAVGHRVQVGTAAVGLGLAALGGFNGEIAVVPTEDAAFAPPPSTGRRSYGATNCGLGMRVTTSDNGITNGIEISGGRGGGRGSSTLPRLPDFGEGPPASSASPPTLYAANNDGYVRAYDCSTWQRTLCVSCGWAVNFATLSPDGSLVAAVGDDPDARLLDPRCCGGDGGATSNNRGNGVAVLKGHLDYSFAAAWHPSGVLLATGNQDATTRVWDLRCTRESLHVLRSELGAVRSLRFSPDGALLAAAEPADFVRVFDVRGESGGGCGGGGLARRLRGAPSGSDDDGEGEGEASDDSRSCCDGGGCPRCVEGVRRERVRLARLRRRRRLEEEADEARERERKEREGGGGEGDDDEGREAEESFSPSPRGPFETCQSIDFFGEVAGISWSPCGTRLSVAVADATYSSLLQYDRI